ncbi:MAG: hypothetical protein ACT4PP_02600 [Sporichthyaceae bacterium]
MTDPRPATAVGIVSLSQDAARLAAIYPPHPSAPPRPWHPAPVTIPPVARRLGEGMPPYIN